MDRKQKIEFLKAVAAGRPATKTEIDLDRLQTGQLNRLLAIVKTEKEIEKLNEPDREFVLSLPTKQTLNHG